MAIWLTVPTRGDNPDLLRRLVRESGVPRERVIIVRTAACGTPEGVHVVDDMGEVNIQRWWNAGIRAARDHGMGDGDYVAVLNDDVRVRWDSIIKMAGAMALTDSVLCWAWPKGITGWAWMLRPGQGVAPDERYRWWFGDNDLAMQAGTRAVGVEAGITHLGGGTATHRSEALAALGALDEALYYDRWGRG